MARFGEFDVDGRMMLKEILKNKGQASVKKLLVLIWVEVTRKTHTAVY